MSDPFVVTPPPLALVLLEDQKRHSRITNNAADLDMLRKVEVATLWAEDYTRKKFLNTVMRWNISRFDDPIPFSWAPLVSVDQVTYIDNVTGATQTVATTVYEIRPNRIPAELALQFEEDWPTDVRVHQDVITIDFTVGYGVSRNLVPESIRNAVQMIAQDLYDNPSSLLAEPGLTTLLDVKRAAEDLLGFYKSVSFD